MIPEKFSYFEALLPPRKEEVLTWRKKFGRLIYQSFSLTALSRQLRRNRFAVESGYLDKLLGLIATSTLNSTLGQFERLLMSKKIAEMELTAPPVFILGHWRNGTTLLHNLMSKDPNFSFPVVHQAVFPSYFLLPRLERMVQKIDRDTPIKTRPMDNVKFGMYEPWEDEFILAALTGISPYARALFPRSLGSLDNYHYPDLDSPQDEAIWKEAFLILLKRLTLARPGRLLLKSPTHTARIRVLLELFPQARFVHIIRHPYDVFPSNLKLWRDAFLIGSLQSVTEEEIVEIVLSTYEQVYERYHSEKKMIPASNLVEIKYEDLQRNPLGELERIYRHLELPDFDRFTQYASDYLRHTINYKKNVFCMPAAIRELVRRRWATTFDLYGYEG